MLPETQPFLSKTTAPPMVSACVICTQPFGLDARRRTTVPSTSRGMTATTRPCAPGAARTLRPFGSLSMTYASTPQGTDCEAAFCVGPAGDVPRTEAAQTAAASAATNNVGTVLFFMTAEECTTVSAG